MNLFCNPKARGQTMMADLTFSLVLFSLLLVFTYIHFQTQLSVFEQETSFDDLSYEATLMADTLVSSMGTPAHWHTLSTSEVTSIGLSRKKRILDEDKVLAFQNFDYNTARSLFKLGNDHFYFHLRNDAGVDLNAGVAPGSLDHAISLRRVVDYNGMESIVEVVVYR